VDESRERDLLRQVPTIRSTEEPTGFREQLARQNETPSAGLVQALTQQEKRFTK
jgi:hypothetical protein